MKKVVGFTLVELMIVVAIIGILAAIAVPSYQDYSVRAKISEGFMLSGPIKLAVAETFLSEGRFLAASNASYGLPTPASIAGDNVDNVAVGASGVITITYSNIGGTASSKTILLTPDTTNVGAVNWICSGGSITVNYLPSECR